MRCRLIGIAFAVVVLGCGGGTRPCDDEVCDGVDNDCDGWTDEGGAWGDDLGFSCFVGQGACQTTGTFICDETDRTGPAICAGRPGERGTEICNGIDDDCDGATDEEPRWANLNEICTDTLGLCLATGIFVCDVISPEGPTLCSAVAGPPVPEKCNGLDDDCDGLIDEGAAWADLNEPCMVGVGLCQRASIRVCDPSDSSGPTVCQAIAGTPAGEVCNGFDDDCDASIDEDPAWADLGDPCISGIGQCQRPSIRVCDPADAPGPTVCYTVPVTPGIETCNGLDDDCDGQTDEMLVGC